jgi:predicted transposase/invertase (TIGR01784 family)
MAKPWDDSLKKLVQADPQAFVSWFVPGASFIGARPQELKHWTLEVDALLEVKVGGEDMLLHLEFQTYNDPDMAERLLRYNVLTRSEHKLPVLSCVIYLLDEGEMLSSPLIWIVPNGQEVLRFHYQSIALGVLSPEDLLRTGQTGLLPLLPLTKRGARREIVESMFNGLLAAKKPELVSIGYTLASLAFSRENAEDQDWLLRRFHEMHDILRETPIYQEILKEGREEGLEEGLEQGLQRGQLEALSQAVIDVVVERFPKLVRLAKKQVAAVEDPDLLRHVLVKVSIAQSLEEARQLLLAVDEAQELG